MIEQQCARLVSGFAYFVDRRCYTDLVQLFTEDGVFVRPDRSFSGPTAILEFLNARSGSVDTRHVCTVPYFSNVTPAQAEAVTYLTVYQTERTLNGIGVLDLPIALGEYHDHFLLTANGWRIRTRVVRPVMMGKV